VVERTDPSAMSELSQEADRVLTYLASVTKYGRTTVEAKVAKELLLYTEGWMMSSGRAYDIKTRSLGAGVWQVWLEARP
jgi:hypothetical protein